MNLFIQFVTTSPTLNAIASERNSLADLQRLPGDKGCALSHVAKLCRELSDGLRNHPQVQDLECRVISADRKDGIWNVALDSEGEQEARAEALYLCTGSVPATYHLDACQELPLLTALTPSLLKAALPRDATVVVVGNSHSAVLVLKNLYDLEQRPAKVIHYARHPLKYAVYMDGWILYDNTGLKGVAAEWAKEVLDKDAVDWPGYTRVSDETGFKRAVEDARSSAKSLHVVGAIGFQRDLLPDVREEAPIPSITHDRATGQLQSSENSKLDGLYGFGIAFPELWTDPYGNKENHVGLWKFMKYIRRSVPQHLGVPAA